MQDIGMPPDYRSMSPDQKNYEVLVEYGVRCPWCGEDIENIVDEDLETLFWYAIMEEETMKEEYCDTCSAALEIRFKFIQLAQERSAQVEPEITATKRVA